MKPRIQTSVLPRDTDSEVEFNMPPFTMFNSMPGSVNGNIFELCKRYRSPRARTKKIEGKREDFFLWSKSKKREEIWKMTGVG